MKLLALVVASLLAVPALAEDTLNPPGGPVYVESAAPPAHRPHKDELRRALMQQFDRDGDGRLNGRERMRAARVLARIQQKLAGRGERGPRGEMRGEMRQQRMEQRRLRREQRLQQRDMRGDAQVDVYVR